MGAKTLSNAGLCWQLGAVEKIAPYGRSLLTREQQAQVDRGSDSHVFLRVARVWEKRLCLRGRGPGRGDHVGNPWPDFTGTRTFGTFGQK